MAAGATDFYLLYALLAVSLTGAASSFHMAPCSTPASNQPCVSVNNCSGRQSHESCVMVVSLPPEADDFTYDSVKMARPTSFEVWSMGLVSVGIISLSGVTGAVLWPVIDSPLYGHVMASLIGLAVGSLTSTAIFQLIPEAFQLTTTDSKEYLKTAIFAWLSIWTIFAIEALSKIIFMKQKPKKVVLKPLNGNEELQQLKEANGHQHQFSNKASGSLGAVAWMIIFGDGLHNFIDGMTIGAGYSQSIPTGVGLSIAIACEEFPHELGDFAILLQSGISLSKALAYNFLSACTAFVGLIFGIVLGQLDESHYIFAFAGGIFLYVSLTHLIPELHDMLKSRKSRCEALSYLILQNVGMVLGTCIIFFITKYNEQITNIF